MKHKPLPSLAYLNACFELSESSPSSLVWKIRPRGHFNTDGGWGRTNSRLAGKPAGCLAVNKNNGQTYFVVGVDYGLFKTHRIVFALFNKKLPPPELDVDHIDTDSLNNAPLNLRIATASQNGSNQILHSNNKSGYKGVSWHKASKTWQYQVWKNKVKYGGHAPTAEKADELARELRKDLHLDFHNHGDPK